MTREKVQKIFIYSVVALLAIAIIAIVVFFVMNYLKWQGYRNDPNQQKFVAQIEEILAKKDKTGDDILTLGNAYYNLGENRLAISAYKKALSTEAKDVAGINLANAYITAKEYKKAEQKLLSILKEKDYGDYSLYMKLADLYRLDWRGKGSDTIGILMDAYNKMPSNVEIIVRIADYYSSIGQNEWAIEYYKNALEFQPDNESIKQEIERLSQ